MITYMTRRMSLVFYRASTYRGLVKLFCIVCYIFALLFFFGTISHQDNQTAVDIFGVAELNFKDGQANVHINDNSLVVTSYDIERARTGRTGMIEAGKDVLHRALEKDTITEVRIEK